MELPGYYPRLQVTSGLKVRMKMDDSKKNYVLTDETISFEGHTLHRIRALRDLPYAKAGELGGFIEKEENLINDASLGRSWVGANSKVFGNAKIEGHCINLRGQTIVCDDAVLIGDCLIGSDADYMISASDPKPDCVRIGGKAHVANAMIGGHINISGKSKIYASHIHGFVEICGNNIVNNSVLSANSEYNPLKIYDAASLESVVCEGGSHIYGKSTLRKSSIFGDFEVCGDLSLNYASLHGHGRIENIYDYFVYGPIGYDENYQNRGQMITAWRSNDEDDDYGLVMNLDGLGQKRLDDVLKELKKAKRKSRKSLSGWLFGIHPYIHEYELAIEIIKKREALVVKK